MLCSFTDFNPKWGNLLVCASAAPACDAARLHLQSKMTCSLPGMHTITASGPSHLNSSQTWRAALDFLKDFFSFFQQRIFSEVENSAAQITDSFVNDCYEWVDKHWETTFVRFGKTYPAKWALFHQHFLLQEGMLIDTSVSPLAHVLTLLSALCYLQGCLLSNGVAFWSFFSSTCTRI